MRAEYVLFDHKFTLKGCLMLVGNVCMDYHLWKLYRETDINKPEFTIVIFIMLSQFLPCTGWRWLEVDGELKKIAM